MRDDDVFDLTWIESNVAQSSFDEVLSFARIVERVDHDDALGCCCRLRRNAGNSDEIQIIEDFHRRGGVVGGTWSSSGRTHCAEREAAFQILSGCCRCGGDMGLLSVRCRGERRIGSDTRHRHNGRYK